MSLDDLLKLENFKLLLQLLVPGFVIAYVRAQLVANRRLPFSEAIAGYVAVSFVYQAPVFPLTAWLKIQKLDAIEQNLSELLVSIVLPAVLGLLIGMNARQGWSRAAFSKIGVHLNHPVNTAWDWRFVGQAECWVHIVMKDDTKWAGHLGSGSFISTDPSERDIYIENVYGVDDDDVWTRKGSAVWLPQSEIRSLEFWPTESAAREVWWLRLAVFLRMRKPINPSLTAAPKSTRPSPANQVTTGQSDLTPEGPKTDG